VRVLGIDPGLRCTGWGVIVAEGNRLSHVANGVIRTDATQDLARRLDYLHGALGDLLRRFAPDEVAVEETLANQNPASTLKLGMARGIALLAPASAGLPIAQYLPMIVKKAVVGTGHAEKAQVAMMVGRLLPGVVADADAADALAVAICHSHHRQTLSVWVKAR
jgi:crossover junction endodeoxyribonuclease RuvC